MKQAGALLIILITLLYSCESDTSKKRSNNAVIPSILEVKLEGGNYNITSGESVVVLANILETQKSFSDITLLVNGVTVHTADSFPFNFTLQTDSLFLGKVNVKLSAYDGNKIHGKSLSFTLFSPLTPKKYSYKVIQTYEHDVQAYTQGLLFHDGALYEGTGHKGSSSLRKVNLENGKIQKIQNNDDQFFGEGITYLNNKFYQLSWTAQVAFVYDMEFNELNRFYYQGQGWGLTTDSIFLIRSDGSNKLFFHNPNDFSIQREIEVYTNETKIDNLNELEYVNGNIYANIWQKNTIAIIDPISGTVKGMIDLKNILPDKYRDARTEVLNGIAYDAKTDRLFVTGKYWSKLFEIEIVEKQSL